MANTGLSAIIENAVGILVTDKMNKIKIIESILSKNVSISFCESGSFYYTIIPAKIQREYGIPKRITAQTEDALIDRLFDSLTKDSIRKDTLSEVYQQWFEEQKKDPDKARHTIRKYECDWNSFFKDYPISKAPVAEITPADLFEHFKTITTGRALRKKAFGNVKTLSNLLWDWAYRHNMVYSNISRNLVTKTLKFKVGESTMDLTYTPNEREQLCDLLEQSDNPLDLVIVMMFCLGCRAGEAKALYWSDCDMDNGRIWIRRELVDDEGEIKLNAFTKNGIDEGIRELPMTDRARRILNKIPRPENKDSFIFLWNGNTLKTQTINSHIQRACEKLGIRYLSSHKIRATQITQALATGMDQASVMRIAGHATPQTMAHYVRVARVDKDISEKFNAAFN